MNNNLNTLVRFFGALQTERRKQGLPALEPVHIPHEGCAGFELAESLKLSPDKVEGVFINGLAYSLEERIRPGDKVAFIAHFPTRKEGKGTMIK